MSEPILPAPEGQQLSDTARRPWVAPELRTMRAGSAESGPNPIVEDGIFSFGS